MGGRALAACRAGISVAAYHTCLDIVAGGVNDSLALALGIKNARPFVPYGRIGTVRQTAFAAFARKCEKALGVRAQTALDCGVPVQKIALVSGSGKSEVKSAHEAGADTFVTGEVTYTFKLTSDMGFNSQDPYLYYIDICKLLKKHPNADMIITSTKVASTSQRLRSSCPANHANNSLIFSIFIYYLRIKRLK